MRGTRAGSGLRGSGARASGLRGSGLRVRLFFLVGLMMLAALAGCTATPASTTAPGPQPPSTTTTSGPLPTVPPPTGGQTRMLTKPAISGTNIAFVYAGDLWVADLSGQNARRLTVDGGVEDSLSGPSFSPDGSLLAFSETRNANTDVYVVPVAGGTPQRLTWHPARDLVQGFAPDGSAILFSSDRGARFYTEFRLYTISPQGGFEKELSIPNAFHATYSPDGSHLAYNPWPPASDVWMGYRGGRISTIWLCLLSNLSITTVPQPQGGYNDADPAWIAGTIYFRSDRDGLFNLMAFDPSTSQVRALTNYKDFPVLNAAAGGGRVIYEQAGTLHIYDPSTARDIPLPIDLSTDLPQTRERYVKGADFMNGSTISPGGVRAAFEMRGDIVTVPAAQGDARNITNSPGVYDKDPAWSPDGKTIAYLSDESGEYQLYLRAENGQGSARAYPLQGAGYYRQPTWSPDGKKIAYMDQSWTLYWLDVGSGGVSKVGTDDYWDANIPPQFAWAPDSQWIAYTKNDPSRIQSLFVYSLETGASTRITDGMAEVSSPAFDANGRYLYFLASTDAGPGKWFMDMSAVDMQRTDSLYVAILQAGAPSPLAPRSDEVPGSGTVSPNTGLVPASTPLPANGHVTIDFTGLADRIEPLPLPAGVYKNLTEGSPGQLYYLKGTQETGANRLTRFTLDSLSEEVMLDGVSSYEVSGDHSKVLVHSGDSWQIVPASGKAQPGQGKLALDSIQVRVDPRAEWAEMYVDAWRINRDYFYDPAMYGLNWNAMRAKYAAFLPDLTSRADLNRLLKWLLSELQVSHHYVSGGDLPDTGPKENIGLLGADYQVDSGRYRISHIYTVPNWIRDLTAPLAAPGVDVKQGDYLLAVNGQSLNSDTNIYEAFRQTAGKATQITVGSDPTGKGSRTVAVVPIEDEEQLRLRDWIEGNIEYVTEATGGKVGYVYLPDTASDGHDYMKQYFFPQAARQAFIIDERFNRGGLYADYVLNLLNSARGPNFDMRFGAPLKTPGAYIPGPNVMLVNESAGSGGDMLAWGFRNLGEGKLVGTRTWGGLVGITGYPPLMDGGYVTAPNLAGYDKNGWIIENKGVAPDVQVEQLPADSTGGRDPQLEAAVKLALEQLATNPPAAIPRPPYPRKGATP
jgi:tricorn protease